MTYDSSLRRSTLALNSQSSTLNSVIYGYDPASRLLSVTDNSISSAPFSATYTYIANSPLVQQIVFNQGTAPVMTTTKQYDFLNRLTSIASSSSASSSSFSYSYNTANQRTRSTLADNAYWVYTYDALGQVKTGKKYWSDGTAVAGQQFEYTFDDIGNRTQTKAGGDNSGANLHSATYGANSLNQYTNRTVPGYVQMLGSANSSAAVTLFSSWGTPH